MIQASYCRFVVGVVVVPWLLLAGCTAFGPKRVPPDRFNYNQAIGHSWNEQLLLNIVRARYLEVPVFLSVSSVLTQYTYAGNIGASGSSGRDVGLDTWAVGGEAGLEYSERPTITYTPLGGSEFARRLLSPVSAEVIFSLGQSGWPLDEVLPICLQRLNEVENMSFDLVPSPGDLERLRRFRHFLELLTELSDLDAIEMYRDGRKAPFVNYLEFAENEDPDTQAIIDEVKHMLGLDPRRNVFQVTERLTRRRPDEITVQMRSLTAMMRFVARGVEIPAAHLEERRAAQMPFLEDDETSVLLFPWRIRSRIDRPDDASVAVRYQGHWFYIEISDQATKRAMLFLTFFFRLLAPDVSAAAPILTLPTGP